MTLQSSGTISLNDVNVELQNSGTSLISLNDTEVRDLADVVSGTISMSNLYGKSFLPTFSFVNFLGDDTGSSSSVVLSPASGTTTNDVSIVFAWVDSLNNPTLTASAGWTKIGQTSSTGRPACAAFYSTTATSAVTISSTIAGAWNGIWHTFRPNRPVESVSVSDSSFIQDSGVYTHTTGGFSLPLGTHKTLIHVFGVSGRPQDNQSIPASITGTPTPTSMIDLTDTHAASYRSIFSVTDTSFPTYSYNNINDSGQQSSGAVWLAFD